MVYSVNPGLINHGLLIGVVLLNNHYLIRFYGTLTIQ